ARCHSSLTRTAKHGELGKFRNALWARSRGGHNRLIGQDATGSDVAALGDLVALMPEGTHNGEPARIAHFMHARGAQPRIGARGRSGSGADGLEFFFGPWEFAARFKF